DEKILQEAWDEVEESKESPKLTNKEIELQTAKAELRDCIIRATETYHNDWNINCNNLGKEDNCSLPKVNADLWAENRNELEDGCYRLFEAMTK
ncbi:unnamed protein product, partial [marine sediment metagenome]